MVDVEHGGLTEPLAVRVAPLHYQVFPETRFAEQYRLMRMNWAYPGPKPTATRALTWLKEHEPSEPDAPVLLWGDARSGSVHRVVRASRELGADRMNTQEDEAGRRVLEEAVRVRPGEASEYLGRPSYSPVYADGTRDVVSARIGFSPPGGKPFDLYATPLLPVHLMALHSGRTTRGKVAVRGGLGFLVWQRVVAVQIAGKDQWRRWGASGLPSGEGVG